MCKHKAKILKTLSHIASFELASRKCYVLIASAALHSTHLVLVTLEEYCVSLLRKA